ncbi:hypothetical protein BC835DRAFT_654719 [Cytidiella melzeri]|nr:hypothetical protein BC835DRAFT_654719 [Cytidiella melzeri]
MEVDDEALPLYAHPTKASAAKESGPKAKKTLDSICVALVRASRRESGSAVSDVMTSADEGGAASETEEIMTPEARKSYTNATKAKRKDKAPAKSLFEAASASTSTTAPPASVGA